MASRRAARYTQTESGDTSSTEVEVPVRYLVQRDALEVPCASGESDHNHHLNSIVTARRHNGVVRLHWAARDQRRDC